MSLYLNFDCSEVARTIIYVFALLYDVWVFPVV